MMKESPACDLLQGHLFQGHCVTPEKSEAEDSSSVECRDLEVNNLFNCNGVNEPPKLLIQDQIQLTKVLEHKDLLEFSVVEFQWRLDGLQNALGRIKTEIQMVQDESEEETLEAQTIAEISLKVDKNKRLMALLSQEDALLNELEETRKSFSLASIEKQSFALEMNQRIDEIYRIHATRKDFEFNCRLQRQKTIRRNAIKSRQRDLSQCAAAEQKYYAEQTAALAPKRKLTKESLQSLRTFRKKTLDEIASRKKNQIAAQELRRMRQKTNVLGLKRELDEQRETLIAANKLRKERALEEAKSLEIKRDEIIAAGGNPFILERLAERQRAEQKQQEEEHRLISKLVAGVKSRQIAEQRRLKLRQELDQIWKEKANEKRLVAKKLEAAYFNSLQATNRCDLELESGELDLTSRITEVDHLFTFDPLIDREPMSKRGQTPSLGLTFDLNEDGVVEELPRTPVNGLNIFRAIPEKVIFKDFDLGKSYRKKVIISNRSNQRLRFYLKEFVDLGSPQNQEGEGQYPRITDVVKVTFDTPLPLFPGLTHEFFLTFTPKTFDSWTGELHFESPAGLFIVPVECFQKQFEPTLSTDWVTFDNVVAGTTATVKVKVVNRGSLPGTIIQIKPVELNKCMEEAEVLSCDTAGVESHGDVERDRSKVKRKKRKRKKNKELKINICQAQELEEDEVVPELTIKEEEKFVAVSETVHIFSVTVDDASKRIPANGEVTLDVTFQPETPGEHLIIYEITFENPNICSLKLCIEGNSITNPFIADPLNVNLNICRMYLKYQQPIEIRNLSKSRGKIVSKVPPILKPFVEIVPKIAQSLPGIPTLFTVKFNPRYDLLDHLSVQEVFDVSTRILDFPVSFLFENFLFTTPDPLVCTFQAILDDPQLAVFPADIDFGTCCTAETVRTTVSVRNIGAVKQTFGFVEMPEWIAVQPNYGFGTLLPGESRDLDLLLSPSPTLIGKHTVALKVRTLEKKDTVINVKFVGRLPTTAMTFSHILFPVTCIGSSVSAVTEIYIKGSKSKFRSGPLQRMPRPSMWLTPPAIGPTAKFEFLVDVNYPIEVTPSTGTIEPGKGQKVLVTFKADLTPKIVQAHYPIMLKQKFDANRENVAVELTRIRGMLAEIEAIRSNSIVHDGSGDAQMTQNKRISKSRKKSTGSARKSTPTDRVNVAGASDKRRLSARSAKVLGPGIVTTLDDLQLLISDGTVSIPVTQRKKLELRQEFLEYVLTTTLVPAPPPAVGTVDYVKTRRELLKEVSMRCDQFLVPCRLTLSDGREEQLLITVKCPLQKPDLVILDDLPKVTFGPVRIGTTVIQELNLHNTSVGLLNLKMDAINPYGPFSRVNALRPLAPNLVFTLRIKFAPVTVGKYHETVEISGGDSRIVVTLTGTAMMAQTETATG